MIYENVIIRVKVPNKKEYVDIDVPISVETTIELPKEKLTEESIRIVEESLDSYMKFNPVAVVSKPQISNGKVIVKIGEKATNSATKDDLVVGHIDSTIKNFYDNMDFGLGIDSSKIKTEKYVPSS